MSDPDSIVEYVRWLDSRLNRLANAILEHKTNKQNLSIPGSIDGFDHELWKTLDWAYNDD